MFFFWRFIVQYRLAFTEHYLIDFSEICQMFYISKIPKVFNYTRKNPGLLSSYRLTESCSRYIHNSHILPVVEYSVVGRPVVIVIPASKTAVKRIIGFLQAEAAFVNQVFNNCSQAGYVFMFLV